MAVPMDTLVPQVPAVGADDAGAGYGADGAGAGVGPGAGPGDGGDDAVATGDGASQRGGRSSGGGNALKS